MWLALAATILGFTVGLPAGSVGASPNQVTYTNTQTIPVPPASSYAGSGGGDGWSLAFSSTQVFNVFHHQGTLQVACHQQSDASACYSPVTVTDANGHNFATSGHPGMYFDPSSQKLYVYATRDDQTAGVVCFDTQHATTAPFCGFTALTAVGDSYISGNGALSAPVQIGTKLYAYNYVPGASVNAGATHDENALLCFDLTTDAACSGQPYQLAFASGSSDVMNFPEPSVAGVGGKLIISNEFGDTEQLGCFDPSTLAACAGSWPIAAPSGYTGVYGAPFPLPSSSGSLLGFCLPDGTDECYSLSGASISSPSGLAGAITASDGWNGPAVVLGPRIYVANGNEENVVRCYDASTNAECTNFPKSFANLGYIYTTTLDPQRPTCIWVNSDNGADQIQNFDAYTGGACGQGPIRVLASSFVVNQPQCTPGSYTTLKVDAPARNTYASGSVQFLDGDANPLPGVSDRSLDNTGTVDLTGLSLNSATGLPQFLITLTGYVGNPGAVTVTLVWTGTQDASCVGPGTTVTGTSGVTNPTITAHVVSKLARSRYGWYRTPVIVSFTCTVGSAPLSGPCPSRVTLNHNGANQSVSRTITATDGGSATGTVSGIEIDTTRPTVAITGVASNAVYAGHGPTGQCVAHDALSGIASCTLTHAIDGSFEYYSARAVDKAGNVATAFLGTLISPVALSGAPFSNGAYTVRHGLNYTINAATSSQPRFVYAVPYHQQPTVNGPLFHHVGTNRWSLVVQMLENQHQHSLWNIGVRVGNNLYILTLHVVA